MGQPTNGTFHIRNVSHGGHQVGQSYSELLGLKSILTKECFLPLIQVLPVIRHGHESCGPHPMAYKHKITLSCLVQNCRYHSRQVIVGHLINSKVPVA